ncbi:hypothetical protein CJ030_MR7G000032 [Morella rubra]|uniref:Uncharacterized protein n=1 Tax=Morella rubra TaxID=262757 RepID=A0A6A1V1F6_9ROSI|nr:hypothetical protein CJ030_MR7G000032 [Morella rubra]
MYVTRPLSMYQKHPDSLSLPPPEGPSSGILVIQDEEAEPTCCFGMCKTGEIKELPFPQNKSLELRYTIGIGYERTSHFHNVTFIPVLNQPLSSNCYYAVQPYGKHREEAYTNSKEEDTSTCCFGGDAYDVPPQPLDPTNVNQQFQIRRKGGIINNWGGFVARSAGPDGLPPFFLRRKGWKICASASPDFELGEAQGLDSALRARLPDFAFPLPNLSSKPVVVGKWYCPVMFIREGTPKTLMDGRRNSIYYEITLEQKWEQIFASENNDDQLNAVAVEALVKREVVTVGGREAVIDERNVADGLVWFTSSSNVGEETRVAMGLALVGRMKWEQERAGWLRKMESKP